MNSKSHDKIGKIIRIIPAVVSVVVIVFAFFLFRNTTFEDIVNFTPKNVFLSVAVMLALYAVKSISVVIPLTVFFVAGGVMYGMAGGIFVSILGLSVSFTLPYLIGRFSGAYLVGILEEKYPKIKKITEISNNNNFFVAYITRAVVFVPGDVVSTIHGATKMKYVPYLLGSILGVVPEMVFQVMIGHYIGEPVSAKMIISLVVMIVVSAVFSFIINRCINSKKKSEE